MLGGSIFSRAAVAAGRRQLEAAAAARAEQQRAATLAADAGESDRLAQVHRPRLSVAMGQVCLVKLGTVTTPYVHLI